MFKVYTLFFLFSFSALLVTAQFEKGQKLLGGNVAFSSGKSENYFGNNFNNKQVYAGFSPSVAWFTKPNQLSGVGLFYSYQKSNSTSNNNSTSPTGYHTHYIGINVFSQRFYSLATKLYFTIYAGGLVTYNFGKSTYFYNGTQDVKNRGYSISGGLTPGLSYRLTPRLLFDASLNNFLSIGYTRMSADAAPNLPSSGKSYSNNFYISSSLSNTSVGNVGIGFRWLLKK